MIEASTGAEERNKKLGKIMGKISRMDDKSFVDFAREIREEADSVKGDIEESSQEIADLEARIQNPEPDDNIAEMKKEKANGEEKLAELKEALKTIGSLLALVKKEKQRRKRTKEPLETEKEAVVEVEMRAQLHGP